MDENQIEKIDLNKIDWRGSREFFESLGEALDRVDDKDEKYDFTWVGKRKAIIEAGAPINKTFRPDVEASKNWDTTENLFIEGDNLDALKLLQESYLGKVKLIYIDPPYNTGNNLIYKNDFSVDKETYEINEGSVSEYGEKLSTNTKSEGRFHSEWCSMFYTRLKVSRNLLREDGFFICAMDESEIANTLKICDEVFGEDNRLGLITVVHKPEGRQFAKFISPSSEFMLIYARNAQKASFQNVVLDDEKAKEFNLTDEEGSYKLKNFIRLTDGMYSLRENKPEGFYPIYVSEDLRNFDIQEKRGYVPVYPVTEKGVERVWKTYGDSFMEKVHAGVITAKKREDGNITIYEKLRPSQVFVTHWIDKKYHGYHYGTKIINELLGNKIFDFPKSLYLIKDVLKLTTTSDDLVLDFFCGSGTTAHAAMELNNEDGGSRKWIMVQLPETTIEESEAYKAGYRTIPDISRERISRAGEKINSEHPDSDIDYGFRALTIADTNYKEVYKAAGELHQSALLDVVDNVKEDRSDIDLLYGVLTQSALELNRPIEKREIAGSDVYLYDYFGEVSGLIGCFSQEVSEEAIKEIAKLKPLTVVFRDSSFAGSQAKVNLSEHFRVLSPETKVKVI